MHHFEMRFDLEYPQRGQIEPVTDAGPSGYALDCLHQILSWWDSQGEPQIVVMRAGVIVAHACMSADLGGDMLVDVSLGETKLLVKTKPDFKAGMGDDCYLTFDTARWHVFAKDTGLAYF